jgi:ferredoxin
LSESGGEVKSPLPGASAGGLKMRVWVDEERCEGMGICPQIFRLDGPVAALRIRERQEVPSELETFCRTAAEKCPGEAIFLEE